MQPASEPSTPVVGFDVASPDSATVIAAVHGSVTSVSPLDVARDNALHRAAARAAFNAKPVAKKPSFVLVETSFVCPDCQGTFPSKTTQFEGKAPDPLPAGLRCTPCGKIAFEKLQNRERDRIVAERVAKFRELCPPAYRDTVPERLPKPIALARAIAWAESLRDGNMQASISSLLLHGVSRTGKTRIAFEVLRSVLSFTRLDGDPQVFLPGDLARDVAAAYRDGHEKALWSRLTFCPLLILDDLGKEKLTDRVEAFIFELLDRRFSLHAATVITTNHVGEGLAARFLEPERGAALVARLKEFCLAVAV